MTFGLALPLAISCSSPPLSMGARQPVSTVFWATAVIGFLPRGSGYRTVCILHEACQRPPFSKSEALEPLRVGCLRNDQRGFAQSRCRCCALSEYFGRRE